ncbi:MAG: hypothetical protein IJ583_11965 [Firmicutes bacterium]|nr:hypothetical protein [Bacillota bacterium]
MFSVRSKKFCGIFMVIILMMSVFSGTVGVYAASDDDSFTSDYSNQKNEYEPDPTPSLKMANDGMYDFKPGEKREIEITIRNVSSFYAYNILVQAKPKDDKVPLKFNFVENSNIKYTLQNGTSFVVKMEVDVDENAAGGTYALDLNYAYNAKSKSSFNGSDSIYIRVNSDDIVPNISFGNFSSDRANVNAGGKITVIGSVENIGKSDVKNLKIEVSDLSAENISLSGGSNSFYRQTFQKGQRENVSFIFSTNKNLATGSYPVTFKMSYKDAKLSEKDYTYECKYYINVTGKKENEDDDDEKTGDIVVTGMNEPSGRFEVGTEFTAGITIRNTGTKDAKNIKVSTKADEEGAIVPTSSSVLQLSTLKVNEGHSFDFKFKATSKALTLNYSIPITVEYESGKKDKDGVTEKISFVQYVCVNIVNSKKDEEERKKEEKEKEEKEDGKEKKVSTPKIIVSKYETNPIIVEAGKKFDLDMTFLNTHGTKAVKNIKMFFTVEEKTEEKGNVFSPDNSSNTLFIDSLPPKGGYRHVFTMYTVPDAKAKTYAVNVNFEYEDSNDEKFEAKEIIGINVKQSAKLETSEYDIPEFASAGEAVPVSFQLYNTGKVTLSNVMIKITGDEGLNTTAATNYIGELEPGGSEYYDGSFFADTEGEYSGKVIVSYDDTNGEHKEMTKDFSLNVSPVEILDYDEMGEDAEIEEETNYLPYIIGGVAAVIAVVIVIVVIVVKKKKEDLDE